MNFNYVMDPEAHMAYELITRWGMVAAVEDGEDSGGRQKLRLLEPEELVIRAGDTARLFMDHYKGLGLISLAQNKPLEVPKP